MRARLFSTLHTQPFSLLVASACGMAMAWVCAMKSGIPALGILAVALTALSLVLISLAFWLRANPQLITARWLHDYYPILAFIYASMVGIIAAIALQRAAPLDVQVLAVAYAVAYCGGVCFRSAGRPLLALGQMVCALLPIVLASAMADTAGFIMLAIMLFCFAVSMGFVTLSVFRQLADQILALDTSMKHAAEMREQSRTDAVTGLLNRSGFNHALDTLITTLPEGEKVVLIWLDLHRFKEVNETLGHRTGDKILAEAARRMRVAAPDTGIVARFGSDEFLMAARMRSRAECETLASAVVETLMRAHRVDGKRIESGASVGAALMPDDATSADRLMQSADLALFHAKTMGPHKVRFFDTAMTRALARKKEIEDELRSAIQKDELSIFFQPIVDLETGRIRSFEALLRWFHPEKGELYPDEFIPVAEDTGLIVTLGNWITAQAARTAMAWPEEVTLAVNLSPVQIKAPGAALGILSALRNAGLDPKRLELEVTESLFIEDDASTAAFMADLAREGVKFALDDFGTGYSSLHYINRYPFRTIKVDRSFVSGPHTGRRSDAIIRAVAEMGNTLEMEIVAEGLETIDQVQAVRTAGCTLGQGYYFSRAVPDYLAAMLLTQEAKRLGEHFTLPQERLAG
ncbi:putative bifunctional diguanylate cyclase/phosphodiesterase [Aurantiacibacter gangjinensis]|uniref:putative bifunctional diguanylate cyclase/phosphodiesterase n=1 Tax=Aurantiacibacter gangjinensis TaxID=502682 RepID=UPI000909C948|nr:EAL domain-containing protein [Aurantiacibacter gangjinensis]APE28361.1 hypothetical protein BMF35_a1532 [Aurantiacibacter gangjinensis]